MDINNVFALLGCIFLTLGVFLEASLIPRQFKEAIQPRDGFTRMRWYVLARPIVYVLTFSPYIVRLAQVIDQPPRTALSAWVTVSVPFGLLLLAIFTHLSYTYKEKK